MKRTAERKSRKEADDLIYEGMERKFAHTKTRSRICMIGAKRYEEVKKRKQKMNQMEA